MPAEKCIAFNENERIRNYLKPIVRCLFLFGAWPEIKGSRKKIFLTWLYTIVFLAVVVVLYIIFELVDIILSWGDMDAVMENLILSISHFAVIPKVQVTLAAATAERTVLQMIILYSRRKQIDRAIEVLEVDLYAASSATNHRLRLYEQKQIKWAVDRSRNILSAFLTMIVLCAILMMLKPLKSYFVYGKLTLAHRVWLPLDVSEMGFNYVLCSIYSYFCVLVLAFSCTTFDMLFVTLTSHLCVQLRVLKYSLRSTNDSNADNALGTHNEVANRKTEMNIRQCIIHHQKIIQFCNDIESISNELIMIQCFVSLILLAITFFTINIKKTSSVNYLTNVSFLGCVMMEILLYCWHANEVIVESSGIACASYCSEWMHTTQRNKKSLMIINERSKRPLVLTAGKFFILSLELYVSLLKSAYSVMALLNRLYE